MPIPPVYATYSWKSDQAASHFRYCPLCGTELSLTEAAGKDRPTCPACGYIHFQNPSPGIAVLVIDGDRVLLGKRSAEPGKGKWAIPSGYIEFEEDYLAAARREVKEETGLEIEIRSILHVESAFLSPRNHFFTAYLLGRVVGGKLEASDDLDLVAWFPICGPLPEMAFQPDIDLITSYAQTGSEGLLTDLTGKG